MYLETDVQITPTFTTNDVPGIGRRIIQFLNDTFTLYEFSYTNELVGFKNRVNTSQPQKKVACGNQ